MSAPSADRPLPRVAGIQAAPTEQADEQSDQQSGRNAPVATALVNLARERYTLGRDLDGMAYGVAHGGHVVRMLRSKKNSLSAELAKYYYEETARVASGQALSDALTTLEGIACDAEPQEVHLRTTSHQGALYIDVGDHAESVIKVTNAGWSVGTEAPVLFKRTGLTAAFPLPNVGGSLAELWELVNVSDADRALLVGWLVATLLLPNRPVPMLAVFGEQGTGKSTVCRRIVALVDPSEVAVRQPPRDVSNWQSTAANSRVVAIDNASTIQPWFSDSLCRAISGEGDVKRQLYTDSDVTVIKFQRVIILNGIDVGALKGDLADRTVTLTLEPISGPQRMAERRLAAQWEDAQPRLFGALLDRAVTAIAELPRVELATKPRMADFAEVLAALDQEGGNPGALARFYEQAEAMAADSLTSEPFIVAMQTALAEAFIGTSAELLALVNSKTDQGDRKPRDWPGARQVTGLLARNAPALRRQGWTITDRGKANRGKVTRWVVQPPGGGAAEPSQPSQRPDMLALASSKESTNARCPDNHGCAGAVCGTCRDCRAGFHKHQPPETAGI